jgi:hypothetical protein
MKRRKWADFCGAQYPGPEAQLTLTPKLKYILPIAGGERCPTLFP